MTYKINLQPSDESFAADPGESVLEAALRHGLNLPHSCRGGSCLSCRARILAGRVEYPRGFPAALTEAEASEGFALLCQARALTDLQVEARPLEVPGNVRIRRLPCRVQRLERLSEDVMGLYLKLPGFEPFEYLAGQYVDILLADGRRRSFSIANPPFDSELLELHVRRVTGGHFTEHVFEKMKERALLRLEGPLGQFYLRDDQQRPLLMMAGGTGYAPIKAILRQAFQDGFASPIHFYWGARAACDLYDRQTVEAWTSERFAFVPVLSEPQAEDVWAGRTGWVHRAVLADFPDLSGLDVYAAGPPAMIEAAREEFLAAGLPKERLFFDSFDYAADSDD
ncbi:MAG: CDP-6-deoxy-delta-3,4-glucoseen reductase [Chromatiales bacterium]|jgi:CDP-4-dehydro-6-deoxyglucose reductase|nr:CDP-6-deoxy-delta-3,4-glucoseen reductase [Chromatiales bacterium]